MLSVLLSEMSRECLRRLHLPVGLLMSGREARAWIIRHMLSKLLQCERGSWMISRRPVVVVRLLWLHRLVVLLLQKLPELDLKHMTNASLRRRAS